MKRVMVIGSCGAGKSTFSRKLHSVIKLPLYHLDQHYWKPNWEETSKEEWQEIVTILSEKQEWIIDGNYGGTMEIRMKKADTIIYLDYPTWKCLGRVVKRTFSHWHKVRPDMPEGCKERFDLEFLHYVATFNIIRRKKLLEMVDHVKQSKNVVIIRNAKQGKEYLNSLLTQSNS